MTRRSVTYHSAQARAARTLGPLAGRIGSSGPARGLRLLACRVAPAAPALNLRRLAGWIGPPAPSRSRQAAAGAARLTPLGVVLTAGLAGIGVLTGAAAGAGGGSGRPVDWLTGAALLLVLTAAGYLQVDFHNQDEDEGLDLFETALTPVVFALGGTAVVALTAVAKALSQAALRVPPARAAFNVAQWVCATGVAALAYAAIRPVTPGAAGLVPLLAAMALVPVVNNLCVVTVRRLAHAEPLPRTLAETAPTFGPGLANGAANLCVGVLLTATWRWSPAATPLFVVPLGLMHWAGRAFAALRVDQARLRGLQRATHALAVPVDPRNAIEPFLAEVRRCFQSRVVECVLVGESGLTVHTSDGRRPATARREPDDQRSLAALLLACDRPTEVSTADGSALARALRREGWQSCLVAPMRPASGRVKGALCTYDRVGFGGFEAGELAVLGALAGELSSALERGVLLEAILAERGKLADIVNQTSDGIATLAPDGTVLSWNPGFERISGYSAIEAHGRKALALLAPRDAHGRQAPLERWPEAEVALPFELQISTRTGQRRLLSCAATRTRADDGRTARELLILTARDVTQAHELRRAERALADTETRFRALVRHSSDMVLVVDANAVIRYASPACRRIAGHTEGSWVGRRWPEVAHPDDADEVRAAFGRQLATTGVGEPVEFRIRAADGSLRHIEALPNSLLGDPAVRGVVFNARDVTDRKRADALLASQVTILDLIARDAPLAATLEELATVLEAQADGARCLVLLREEDDEALRVVAAPSLPRLDLWPLWERPDAESPGPDPVAALWEAAVRERAPVVVADTAGDPSWHEHGAALGEGVRAVWVTPVKSNDGARVVGALAVLHDRPRSPSLPDWQVLELATHLAEVAIEQTRARSRLAHQAQHDALTQLPNRLAFAERSMRALERSERTGEPVAVLFLDLDRFKQINDSFGHDAGDRLLVALAQRLQTAVRPGDTLARFGGDEFTILCERVGGEAEAIAIAQRVRQVLADPFALPEGEVFVTGSIGIALATGTADRPETLVENADAAMYRAKARGGDGQEVFDLALRAGAKRRLTIQNSLHRALERGEFRVLYQPTVSLATGQVVGVEALIRWQHPQRGLLEPGEFIALAEESGLIVPIGTKVLEQACREAARWRTAGPGGRPLGISVNLSARQFAHPNLVGVVAGILADTGTDPGTLRLEITESVLMEDAESTNAALRELKALGVRLAIDDFGTGYSSLTYLKRFPVDELKVDRSFVDGLGEDAEDSAIVAAVVNLAHTLDLGVVAEGVETAEQSRHLRELGCDSAQGYHFGRPVPPDELVAARSR